MHTQAHVRNSACAVLLALSRGRDGDGAKAKFCMDWASRLVDRILSQGGYIAQHDTNKDRPGRTESGREEEDGVQSEEENSMENRVSRALVSATRVAPGTVLTRTLQVLESASLRKMRVVSKMLSGLDAGAGVELQTGNLAARYFRFVFSGCQFISSPLPTASENRSERETLAESCVRALADILTDKRVTGGTPRDALVRVLEEAHMVLSAVPDRGGDCDDGVEEDDDEEPDGEEKMAAQADVSKFSREHRMKMGVLTKKMGVLTVSALLNRSAELGILVRPRTDMLLRGMVRQVILHACM
jgi:hypothetical protein